MAVYLVVEVTYTDASWRDEYVRMVPPMLAAAGGRYLAIGNPEVLEASDAVPDTLAIFDFPSAEALKTFLASDEYKPYSDMRKAGSRTQMYMLEELPHPS